MVQYRSLPEWAEYTVWLSAHSDTYLQNEGDFTPHFWYYLPLLHTVDFLYFLCFLIYFSTLSLSIKKTPSPSSHWVTNELNYPVFFYHFNQFNSVWERESTRLSSKEAMGPSLSVRCWFCSCHIRSFSLKCSELATGSGPRDNPLRLCESCSQSRGLCIKKLYQSQHK